MLKKLITLTIVSLAICSVSFADNQLNQKPQSISPHYSQMKLEKLITNKSGNITQIEVRDAKREIVVRFDYFEEKQFNGKYIKANYQYDYENNLLLIKSGNEILFDELDI